MNKNIDTLEAYDDLIKAGVPDLQARAQIYNMSKATDDLITSKELKLALEMLEKDLKIFFVYIVGGALAANMVIPLLFKYMRLV